MKIRINMKNNMIEFCTGCGSCANICEYDSIKMQQKADGFSYPLVDTDTCVECGKCMEVCPVLVEKEEKKYDFISAYALKLKDHDDIFNSASGGAFYALAYKVIQNNGLVYGASYDSRFNVKHIRVDNIRDLQSLRKSKYLQSDTGKTYQDIKIQLDRGINVLFSGTPCQVAGLTSYLKKKYDNLICIQLFCHAIASPGVWEQYILQKELEYKSKLISVDFRHKYRNNSDDDTNTSIVKCGWKNPVFKMDFENGSEYATPFAQDPFVKAFAKELITRTSCYNCKFKLNRCFSGADASIGDFWGADTFIPEFCVDGGVSAIIIHTEIGEFALKEIEEYVQLLKVDVETIAKQNRVVFIPEPKHRNRDAFFTEFAEAQKTPEALIRKHLGYLAAVPELSLNFGLFGSYNSREILNTAVDASMCTLSFQYSNSSLTSVMSTACKIPSSVSMPKNPFRAQMMNGDFEKNFKDINIKDIDYIVIDFLEERFKIAEYNNSIITISDALKDSDFLNHFSLQAINKEKTINNFKESFKSLLEFLNSNFSSTKIILIRMLLCEKYGSNNDWKYFENREEISNINDMLNEYYDYAVKKCGVSNIVNLNDDNLMYCDELHKHGCFPWHLNTRAYEQYAKEFCNTIIEIEGTK